MKRVDWFDVASGLAQIMTELSWAFTQSINQSINPKHLRFSNVCTDRTWRFKCSERLNNLPQSPKMHVKSLPVPSGLNEARRCLDTTLLLAVDGWLEDWDEAEEMEVEDGDGTMSVLRSSEECIAVV